MREEIKARETAKNTKNNNPKNNESYNSQLFEFERIKSENKDSQLSDAEKLKSVLCYENYEHFYWPIEKYPEEIQSKIRINDENLYGLKEIIYKDWQNTNNSDIIFKTDNKKFIDDKLGFNDDAFSKDLDIKYICGEYFSEDGAENFLNNRGYPSDVINFLFKFIESTRQDGNESKYVEYVFPGYNELVSGISYKIDEYGYNNVLDVRNNFIDNIKVLFNPYIQYIPKDIFKKFVIGRINKAININHEKLLKNKINNINKYLNFYFFGVDKGLNLLNTTQVPTIFSLKKIDPDVEKIINMLGYYIKIDAVDSSFMNNVFIHQTDFRVLSDIFKEGGLISHNEILNRLDNDNIKQTATAMKSKHKDVYFYSGYQPDNIYGHCNDIHDMIFFANTINNFANAGYGVPLNERMQAHSQRSWMTSDWIGYSVISKSLRDYSKIDLQDLFIFVSERHKNDIENNNSIDSSKYNIVYIPERYYDHNSKVTVDIHNFIENCVQNSSSHEKSNLIPTNIIFNKYDNINSTLDHGSWAFLEKF